MVEEDRGDGAGRVVHSVMESKKQQWVTPVWFCLELLEATLYVCSCELAESELDFYSNSVKGRYQLSTGVPINILFSLHPKVNDDDNKNELHKLEKL